MTTTSAAFYLVNSGNSDSTIEMSLPGIVHMFYVGIGNWAKGKTKVEMDG